MTTLLETSLYSWTSYSMSSSLADISFHLLLSQFSHISMPVSSLQITDQMNVGVSAMELTISSFSWIWAWDLLELNFVETLHFGGDECRQGAQLDDHSLHQRYIWAVSLWV
uniref:Uncharacterized protein n=1 Tax=Opuntia streptacantha TaxID=393608 RepID=A0A7C8ZW73_OPUST